jgi:hypothetical protein
MCDYCDDDKPRGSKGDKWKLRKLMRMLEEMDDDDDDDEDYDRRVRRRDSKAWKKQERRREIGCETAVPAYGITNTVSPVGSTSISDLAATSQICAIMSNYYIPYVGSSNCKQLIFPSENQLILTYGKNTVLPLEQFKEMFYNGAQLTFCPNSAMYNVGRMKLNNYMVLGATGYTTFSLYDKMIEAFCNARSVNPLDISPVTKTLLQRECAQCQSLATMKGSCVSLTLDQCFENLYSSNSIEYVGNNPDYDGKITSVIVIFETVLNIYSSVLGLKLTCMIKTPVIIPDNVKSSTVIGNYNLEPQLPDDITNNVNFNGLADPKAMEKAPADV